jgi:putative salt-induced outer membrane protein YdiY
MNYPKYAFLVVPLMIFAVFLDQTAYADVLVLKNGDRITGEIKRIWDSEITIEPEYSDEFKVDVPAVDHIESERQFEIELGDGTSLVAQLDGADASGNQIVKSGDETVAVPLAELFELDEPAKEFDWESNVEFSAAVNSGNTDSSNTKLKADMTVEFPDHRHIGEVTFLKEELAGVTTQDQDLFKYNYNWLFRDPWFFSATLSFERDPIIELHQRFILSAGIGRDIWNTPRRVLSIQLGAGAQSEEIGLLTTENGVATWALRYRQDFLSDDLELYHNNSIASNISGRTNTSYKTTTGLRFEVTDLLYANFSIDYDYETHPVGTAVSEDIAVLVGVGLEF